MKEIEAILTNGGYSINHYTAKRYEIDKETNSYILFEAEDGIATYKKVRLPINITTIVEIEKWKD